MYALPHLPRSFLGAFAAIVLALSASADPVGYLGSSGRLSGPGIPPVVDSFFDVFTEIELDPLGGPFSRPLVGMFHSGGPLPPLTPMNGGLHGETRLGGGGQIEIEIISMTLTGGPLLVRESPTLSSVTELPPGIQIASFFDIFYEISLDGGQTWTPGNAPLRMNQVPDAGSVAGLLLAGGILLRALRSTRRLA